MDALWNHLQPLLLTVAGLVGMSLVIPLYLWGATGNLRRSLRAWLDWWLYMLAAAGIVMALALLVIWLESIG